MFGQVFYHGLIRKYVILMGTLLNDIYITRTDENGNDVGLIKVPITYAPKDKMLARVIQDPNIDRPSATAPLPMISFEKGNMYYAGDRKLGTTQRVSVKDDTNSNLVKYQYNWVPYDIEFKAYIYAKNAEDGTKIIEQILPFFTPDWTTPVYLIEEMNDKKDISIILKNIEYQDTYTGNFTERRAIIWTLHFVCHGYLFGPIKKSGIIKFVKVNFHIPSVPDGELDKAVDITSPVERITVQPGLTANGEPTSNISNTIAYTEINIDDDFGYITQIYNSEDLDNE